MSPVEESFLVQDWVGTFQTQLSRIKLPLSWVKIKGTVKNSFLVWDWDSIYQTQLSRIKPHGMDKKKRNCKLEPFA